MKTRKRAQLMRLTLGSLVVALALPAAAQWNPNGLTAAVRDPFATAAETHTDGTWCAPTHWRPWGGDWSCDFWMDNGGTGIDWNLTCGKDVYLKLSPWVLPGGVLADSMRVKVAAQGTACASGVVADGGYYQRYDVYATYRGVELNVGWVILAHLNTPVYAVGTWLNDPLNVRVGTVYQAAKTSACWGSCHVHMEVYTNSATNGSCYYVGAGRTGLGPWGRSSIVGVLGGNLPGGGTVCESPTDESQLACSTWDADLGGCDAHGGFRYGPQDCAYYFCSNRCRARGTSNCEAGCTSYCNLAPSPCSTWDGNVTQCDQHGHGAYQDCAYYFCANRCRSRGTNNCEAGCSGDCWSW